MLTANNAVVHLETEAAELFSCRKITSLDGRQGRRSLALTPKGQVTS